MRRSYTAGITALVITVGAAAFAGTAAAAAPTRLYVDNTNTACTDAVTGTAAAPYCSIGTAAAAAQPGQTVQVAAGIYGEVDITRSGTQSAPITFSGSTGGLGDGVMVGYSNFAPGAYGFKVVGASNIVISGFAPVGNTSAILIQNSSNITIDRNVMERAGGPSIRVTGADTGVTLSRNVITNSAASGIQIDSGAAGTTVTTNGVDTPGQTSISATDAPRTLLTSNTVTSQCGAGITLAGTSTGSTLENNVVDAAVVNSTPIGSCSPAPSSVTVAASAVSGTTADYNLIDPASGGPLYTWNGTPYWLSPSSRARPHRERTTWPRVPDSSGCSTRTGTT